MIAIKMKVANKYDSCYELEATGYVLGNTDEHNINFVSNDGTLKNLAFLDKKTEKLEFYAFPATMIDVCSSSGKTIFSDLDDYYKKVSESKHYLFYNDLSLILFSMNGDNGKFVNWDKPFSIDSDIDLIKNKEKQLKK